MRFIIQMPSGDAIQACHMCMHDASMSGYVARNSTDEYNICSDRPIAKSTLTGGFNSYDKQLKKMIQQNIDFQFI